MNFTDPQLQKCYDSSFNEAAEAPADLRQVHALIATHEVFLLFEGPHSARVHETLERLLLPGLRPELRRWYQRAGAKPDSSAARLKDRLSQLAGEAL